MITPERWARLEPILDRALDLTEDEIGGWLDEACGGDPELRAEAEALVRAARAEGGFLEDGAGDLGAALLGSEASEGDTIGPYRLVGRLGEGGMGVVWLARDPRLEREVALKMLPPWLAVDEAARRRFTREARAASALDHPHIGTVYEIGETEDGELYIAMAHYGGGTLAERIASGPLPVDEAVEIAARLADALEAAHSRGIVHRDVKPSNVILTPDGAPKLVDFGIAKIEGRAVTKTGITPGTVSYMSPEQSRGEEVDGRTDLWSLGVVLYEMLSGRRPFEAGSDQATIFRIRNDAPSDLADLRAEVPPELDAIVRRLMAKDPEGRHADAGELLDELTAIRATSVAPEAGPGRGAPLGRARPKSSADSGRRRAVGLAAAAVVVVAIGLGWFLSRSGAADGDARDGSRVTAAADRILVLPLAPAVPDSGLSRLGRELAVTLSASLGSVGDIRTTEALTVLARFRGDSAPTLARGAELARRLDARSVLRGTLVRSGDAVRADVSLHEAGSLEPVARVSVSGPTGDVAALTDSIALALLRRVWRSGEAPVPSLAALTTHSVESLRAYLEGEEALSRAAFDEAVEAFDRAYAEDTTFHFALWRSLYPRVYEGTRLDTVRYRSLLAHRDEFPTPDRLLLESGLHPKVSQVLEARRRLTTEYASYWPGWYALADLLVHQAPPLGTTLGEARAALERTVELNPDFASAWEHLFWVTVYQRDTTAAVRALDELERFERPGAFKLNPDLLHYYRTVMHLLRNGGGFTGERLALDADYIAGFARGVPDLGFGIGLLDFDFPRAQVQLSEAVLRSRPRRSLTAAMWLGNGLGLAGRGAWDSALVAMDRWVGLSTGGTADEAPDAALVTYGLAVAGVTAGGLSREQAGAHRAAAAASAYADTPEGRAELAWLDGLLAHAGSDPAGLAAARQAVEESGSEFTSWIDRSLAAFQRDLEGDAAGAGRDLAALEIESAEREAGFAWASTHPYLTSLNRLAAVPRLLAAGDTARAVRLLSWHQTEFWSTHRFADAVGSVLAPVALLERARIAAARGDTTRAARDFREFVTRYDLASGPYSAAREEAIGALRR